MYKEFIKKIIFNVLINEKNTFKKVSLEFYLGLTKSFTPGTQLTYNDPLNDNDSLAVIEKIKTIKNELEKRNIKYIFVDYLNDTLNITCDTFQQDDVISILTKYGFKRKS